MLEVEPLREQHRILILCSRQYAQATGLGAALLGLAGGCWFAAGLLNLPAPPAWPFVLTAAVTAGLVGGGCWAAARARRLPLIALALRGVWRKVAIAMSALALAIACAGALLAHAHREALVPVAITLLAGLHALPLARLLYQPLYRQAGLWLTALALSTWAFVPPTLPAGQSTVALWPLVLALGGGGILWVTAFWSLQQIVLLLRAIQEPLQP